MNLASSNPGEGGAAGVSDQMTDLVVRGYSPIGTVMGMSYGSAQVEAREGLIPGRQIAARSVRVELSSGGDYPQTSTAAVEYDNLDRLLAVLTTMQSTNIQTDRFKFTEVEYEIDGLKIIVFNNDRGSLLWALSAESVSIHFNSLNTLGEFIALVERAKSHLDRTAFSAR